MEIENSNKKSSVNKITKSRNEIKFLLDKPNALFLRKEIKKNLSRHVFTKGKKLTLVSTIYFDTPDFFFYKHSEENHANNVKIRAKEYYYFDSELVEHAYNFESLFEYTPYLFLEIKRRKNNNTSKKRIKIEKNRLPEILKALCTKKNIELQNVPSNDLNEFKKEIDIITQNKTLESIIPVAISNYTRDAFENPEGSIRISMDYDLSYHLPPDNLFKNELALVKENLPISIEKEKRIILEVKHTEAFPEWLQNFTNNIPKSDFSKFRHCCRSIYNYKHSQKIENHA